MTENSDWGLKPGLDERPYYPWKAGRYDFRLMKITPGTRKNFEDPTIVEPVIRFIFLAMPGQVPDLGDGYKNEVVVTCTAKLGKKTKLYEVACQLDPSGTIPDALLENAKAFQAHVSSFVGNVYKAQMGPNQKGVIYKLFNFTPVSVTPNPASGGAPPQAPTPAAEAGAPPRSGTLYRYNLPESWDAAKKTRAKKLLKEAGAKEYDGDSWDCAKQIPQLVSIESKIEDDIPF